MPDPAHLFQSLSDPVRLRLLRLLVREELHVQELVAITGLSQPRVSKHLGLLRKQGWVDQRKEGTRSWYRARSGDDAPGGMALLPSVLTLAGELPEASGDDERLVHALGARQAQAKAFFSAMADRWETIRLRYAQPEFDLGLMGGLAQPEARVLDVGTGGGALLPEFAATGARVMAVDLSLPMLVRARKRCRGQAAGEVDFCCGAAEALPVGDGVCDVVQCAMVLHHVAQPGRVVAELARVLRPGGRLAVTSFCAHHQEWMRSELAHQWLGFERTEMERFFRLAHVTPGRWLQRGPRSPDGSGNGSGPNAADWPEVFLMTGIKDVDHGG